MLEPISCDWQHITSPGPLWQVRLSYLIALTDEMISVFKSNLCVAGKIIKNQPRIVCLSFLVAIVFTVHRQHMHRLLPLDIPLQSNVFSIDHSQCELNLRLIRSLTDSSPRLLWRLALLFKHADSGTITEHRQNGPRELHLRELLAGAHARASRPGEKCSRRGCNERL